MLRIFYFQNFFGWSKTSYTKDKKYLTVNLLTNQPPVKLITKIKKMNISYKFALLYKLGCFLHQYLQIQRASHKVCVNGISWMSKTPLIWHRNHSYLVYIGNKFVILAQSRVYGYLPRVVFHNTLWRSGVWNTIQGRSPYSGVDPRTPGEIPVLRGRSQYTLIRPW